MSSYFVTFSYVFKLFLFCLPKLFKNQIAQADFPYPVTVQQRGNAVSGTAGDGLIYYQTADFYYLQNVVNPVNVRITYSSGDNYVANVCFNSNAEQLPISGANLEISCPYGAYGSVSNNTMANGASLPDDGDDTTDDSVSIDLYVKPSPNLGFVLTIPDAPSKQNFTLTFTANQCEDPDYYPIGSNNQCIPIDTLDIPETTTVTIGAGVWKYFLITTPSYAQGNNLNSLNITCNGTKDGVNMYLQKDYLPVEAWHMIPDTVVDDDETTAMILTPGYGNHPDRYFLGLFNSNEAATQIQISTVNGTCGKVNNSTAFGYNCAHISSNVTGNGGVFQYSASIVNSSINNGQVNNGSSLKFKLTDDMYDHDYAYFRLVNLPDYNTAGSYNYFIRVSVANNDVTDLSGAPAVFAKLGGLPSAQSNHYNFSSYGDVVHQLSLPITSEIYNPNPPSDNSWYIAVKLPADFSIWVGANCANNCSNGEHGDCWCGANYCAQIVNMSNPSSYYHAYYVLPSNDTDSAGACSCSKDKYDFSFDCTQKNNGNSALYILLIAIGGLIVLGVAIGVPIYCYLANKKAKVVDEL